MSLKFNKSIRNVFILGGMLSSMAMFSCNSSSERKEDTDENQDTSNRVKLITLNPGHFHAALVQKKEYPGVDPQVHVYAPKDDQDLQAHLALIKQYNDSPDKPTHWDEKVYAGDDFLQKMLSEKAGNVVVLAGNNRDKTNFILESVKGGMNVLSDKPMAIDQQGFKTLLSAFEEASDQNKLLYDIMTERFEITAILQKELSQDADLFGELQKGTAEEPAITKESVHHFYKEVSGKPLIRPTWFFDVSQQGEGIVDVTTHLVDLVQWEGFPGQKIDYQKDIQMLAAKRWPTMLSKQQFEKATKQGFPEFLSSNVKKDQLEVFSNGEIHYKIKDVHAKVSVIWNFEAPEGTGDTHYSIMRGDKANLIIRQGKDQGYKPKLYIEAVSKQAGKEFDDAVKKALAKLNERFEGIEVKQQEPGVYMLDVPQTLITSHEEHFGQVTENFLHYLSNGELPDWEVPNMIAKYYTTTAALKLAQQSSK